MYRASCLGPPLRDANSRSSLRAFTSVVSVAVQGWLVDFLTGFSVPGTMPHYSPEYRHSSSLLPIYDNITFVVILKRKRVEIGASSLPALAQPFVLLL